jgi:hypothetical protein
MIVLTSSDRLQVKLSASVTSSQLECYASYKDTTSTTITAGRAVRSTSNTTAVNLIDFPAASTQRIVDYLSVYNTDTASATVTVQFEASSTAYELSVITLLPGEKLEYQEGSGFRSLDVNGAIKNGNELGYSNLTGINYVSIATDVINNNAIANTIQDITGLSFSVTSGKTYWFKFIIPYTSPAATTGSRFSINGPATSALYFSLLNPSGTGTRIIEFGLTAYDTPAASSTASPNTLSSLAIIEGIATFSASGTLIGRFASEVSNSAITAKAGSVVYYKQLN